jgi:serine/threonine protein kinase
VANSVVELAPGTLLLGKYRVQKTLGKGGMGAVYEVLHEITRHRRALKLLHPSLKETPGAFERFLREASAAGRIDDPHIVDTFDAGDTETGDPYVVMELLDGEPLTAIIARYPGGLPIPLALDLLIQACEGVGAAHRAGIIHRDLKPDNLFVVTREGRPFVKVIDFGISKFEGQDFEKLTQTGFMMGTPLYMPVEQLGGLPVDERADVYALGVILYKSLSGKTPYSGTTLLDLAMKMTAGIFEPIGTVRSDVPAELEQLIHRVLSKAKESRPRNADALAAELRALQSAMGANTRPSLIPPGSTDAGTLILTPTQLAARTEVDEPRSDPQGSVGTTGNSVVGTSAPATSIESPPSRMGVVLGAVAAAAAIAATAFFALRSPAPSPATVDPGKSPASAGTTLPAAVAASGPVVAPASEPATAPRASASASSAPSSTSASTVAAGASPASPVTTSAPTSTGPKSTVPTHVSRPATGGLATDNPYR